MLGRFFFFVAVLVLAACSARPPEPGPSPCDLRVVSLTPSLTELLFDLGAGPHVVGVTQNDSYPLEVMRLPKVGDMHINYEALLALRPTLVVYDKGFNAEQGQRLRSLGVKTLELNSTSLQGLEESLVALGEATGTVEKARQLLKDWKDRLAAIRARGQSLQRHPTVFAEVWGEPQLMTAGKDTYVDELITLAGGRNAYGDRAGYDNITAESLLQKNPDILVLTVSTEAEARKRPGWASLKGKLRRIDSDLLVRPTLRNVQALEQLQKWFSE